MELDIVRVQLKKEGTLYDILPKIETPEMAAAVFRDLLSDVDREVMAMLTLTTRNKPINLSVISVGSLTATPVHPREVFKTAILSNAMSIIVAHNHPSGNVEPSEEDLIVTERLQEAGKLLGIEVIDQIIIGGRGAYYSFQENGMMFNGNGREKYIKEKCKVRQIGR